MVGADEQPADVRDDEPDEPDRTGDRGRGAAEHDGADRGDQPRAQHVLAEAGGEVVAERRASSCRARCSRQISAPSAEERERR